MERTRSPEVPGYRLIAHLGEGGEGCVWLADRLACGTRVALKVFRTHLANDIEATKRIRRGYSVLKTLECDGIAKAVDEGTLQTGELWHATAFVAGADLLSHVNQLDMAQRERNSTRHRWQFPLRPVLELFERVCEAVELAHRLGVIHRDLKPSNIIVDEKGQPWLVDFGLAKEALNERTGGVTVPGQFVGSLEYASPEQVNGHPGHVDHRCDVYSLGVILYQLLTGTFPYEVRGPLSQIFDQIRHAERTPPRTIAPWIDRDLQAIILKAVDRESLARYQSATDLRDDLRRYLDGEAVHAREGGFGTSAIKLLTRHRKAALGLFIVGSLSLTYAISATVLLRRATKAEADALTHAESARAKFRMAQEMAERLLTHVDAKLKDRAGLSHLRDDILRDAYTQFESLLNERSDDPALRADLARTHIKISDIALSLGRLDKSANHRAEALRIRRELANASPGDRRQQMELSIAIVLVGDVLKVRGRTAEAAAQYHAALEIDERLAAAHPDDAGVLSNLAWSYERVGAIMPDGTDPKAQLAFYEKRHAVCEKLIAAGPDNPERLFNLLASHILLGNPALAGADAADAHKRAAIPIADRLIGVAPDDERYVQYYIMTQWAAGRMALDVGDREACLLAFGRSLGQARDLYAREPDRIHFRQLLGNTLENVAAIYLELGRRDVGYPLAVEGLEHLKKCVEQQPDSPHPRFLLASSLVGVWTAIQTEPPLHPNSATEILIRASFEALPPEYAPPVESQLTERFSKCRARFLENH